MDKNFTTLLDSIEFSPLLEDEQKWALIGALENGEPYSQELATAVSEFVKATISFMYFAEEAFSLRVEDLDAEIAAVDAQENDLEDVTQMQEKARKIIVIVNNFMAEAKKIEADLETKVEKIVKEKGESTEIAAIQQFLKNSPQKPNTSGQ